MGTSGMGCRDVWDRDVNYRDTGEVGTLMFIV